MEFSELVKRINKFNSTFNENKDNNEIILNNKLPKMSKDIKGNEYELSQHNWKLGFYRYKQKLNDAKKGIVKKELSEENSLEDVFGLLNNVELTKEWNKIKYEYKKKLINDYLDKIKLDDIVLKQIKLALYKGINEKTLKQKDISYDQTNKKIKSIPFLEKKFNYNIE